MTFFMSTAFLNERLGLPQSRIDAQYILKENGLYLAQRRLSDWYEAKKKGELTAAWFCDDARVLATIALGTLNLVPIRTIAAAGDPEPFRYMVDHRAVNQGIVIGHYDSQLQKPGQILKGCGGAGVKEKRMGAHKMAPADEATGYVDRHIDTPDAALQTLITAKRMAELSNKSVTAALLDTSTYHAIPIGFFSEGGKRYSGVIQLNDLNGGQPILITPENLSQIDMAILPPEMQKLFANNQRLCAQYEETGFLNQFKESQRIQNPSLVMITTSAVPTGVRYPNLHYPNMVFKIVLPLKKVEDDGEPFFTLDSRELNKVIAQTHYPLSHTLSAKPGGVFHDTKTLLIETPNIMASVGIVDKLKKRDWFMKWVQGEGGNIIVAEIHSGHTTEAYNIDTLKGNWAR